MSTTLAAKVAALSSLSPVRVRLLELIVEEMIRETQAKLETRGQR
jgi:hypothetical protein